MIMIKIALKSFNLWNRPSRSLGNGNRTALLLAVDECTQINVKFLRTHWNMQLVLSFLPLINAVTYTRITNYDIT